MKKHGIILLAILGFLLISEIVLRFFFQGPLHVVQFRPPMYELDSVTHYKYIPGDYKISRKNYIHVNKHGFIGDEIKPKSKEVFRIAIVGASETSGSTDFPVHTCFPKELNAIFQKENWNVEVINCGLDGARGYDTYRLISHRVLDLEPDLILMNYQLPLTSINAVREVYKDCVMVYHKGDDTCRTKSMERVDKFYRNRNYFNIIYTLTKSYIMRVPYKIFLKLYRDWLPDTEHSVTLRSWSYIISEKNVLWLRPGDTEFTHDESVTMIKELQEKLRGIGIGFFLFTNDVEGEIKPFAKMHQLPLINTNLLYEKNEYMYGDGHHNQKGDVKTATRFYELLTGHGIIPDYYKAK